MEINIHHFVHFPSDPEEIVRLKRIESKVDQLLSGFLKIQTNEGKIMADLDAVLADVEAEGTQIDSLSVLTTGIKKQLTDALAGTTLPPAVQAKVDAVFAGVETNKQKVMDAINANTDAAPAPATGDGSAPAGGDGSAAPAGS